VPFNLTASDKDIYTKDGNAPIYFQSTLRLPISQEKVEEYFSQQFGTVSFLWNSRDMTDFCVIFLDEESQRKYEQHLADTVGRSSSVIVEIEGVRFLVRSREEQEQLIRNSIRREAEIG
jgi:hypothetical protein